MVENAVLHGIEGKEGPGFVRVFAGMEQGFILLSVEDDGVGMSEEQLRDLLHNLSGSPKDDGRIGMRNVSDRIKLFYEGKGDFRIESRPGEGTKITLKLPCLEEKPD